MNNEIFVLRPITGDEKVGPWHPWYDKIFGFVICASTQSEARAMAAAKCGAEGAAVWLDPRMTTCTNIDNMRDETRIIMRDCWSA